MSLDHQYQENIESETEEQKKEKEDFYSHQIDNMYDEQKFVNPHDIAGTLNLVEAQDEELNIKKVQFRMMNELYLRKHPELSIMIQVFLFKVLEERPANILAYAGKFFDQLF